ncbi:Vegetative incompatibility protein HET-E-1 [Rhizoctonia solani]|uniref:Vegetative incompatibility protein HET-E-1 n=1 Tax=Rhizoctonia solani TaxID=456999 RepID=A0A8H8NMW3_9AGAM|nr:Vegetative incompatibility protein HET-E-1 [Rhizoctonia solani]QRW15547.1 Vegetative incompatibility protein HET-E-1 [Rhizoctonia solani]
MQPRRVFGTLPQLDNPEHDHVMELTSPMQGMEQGHQEGVGITPSKQADQPDMESFQLATARILDPRHENPGNNTPLEDPATREKETPLVDKATRNKTVKDFIEDFFAKFPEETQPPKTEANRKWITNDHLTSTQKVYGFLMELVMGVKRLEKHIDNHLKMEQEMLDQGISQEVIDELDKILPLSSLWEAENNSESNSDKSGSTEIQCENIMPAIRTETRISKATGNATSYHLDRSSEHRTEFPWSQDNLDQWAPPDPSMGWDMGNDQPPITNIYDWHKVITRCDSFQQSKAYAKLLDPSATLDYIPMGQQWKCYWIGRTLRCPTRGYLRWVGNIEEIDPEWWIPISTVREWLATEIENWKNKLPSGLGGYVDNLTPEDVYYMILERKMSIEDLHDWLKQWAMQAAQNDLSRSISNLAIHELSDEGGHESDLESNKAMNKWNPLDYADGM